MTEGRGCHSIWSDLGQSSFSQRFIDAGGIRTRILTSGSPDKPLLLLIHGTGCHAEAYVRNMQSHGEHFWTVAMDLVGHGWSDRPEIDYEIPASTDNVLRGMAEIGRDKADRKRVRLGKSGSGRVGLGGRPEDQ